MIFKRSNNENNSTPFIDILFNCLVGFVFILTMAFLMINPDNKKEAKINTKAEFVITVTWDFKDINDVDTWTRDPVGNVIFFRNKEDGLTHLDRDDRGDSNDTYILPGGKIVSFPYNQELTTIRGIMPGEWIINIHLYAKRKNNPYKGPTQVKIRIDKLNPKVEMVFEKKVILTEKFQEETVIRFILGADGKILAFDDLPYKMIRIDGSGRPQAIGKENSYIKISPTFQQRGRI